VQDQHLLSLKDNDQSANLAALAAAGIGSFKIEGRLKDLSYVKNITAHYRQQLDALLDSDNRYARAASGRCTFGFTPRPEKTFNRGATDYFVNDRQTDIGAFASPKFTGEPIGRVSQIGRGWFEVEEQGGTTPLNNGDGLCFFDAEQTLVGLRINRAEGQRLFPAEWPKGLAVGTRLHRNHDQAFERALGKDSATRRIDLALRFSETANGFALRLTDADGISVQVELPHSKDAAKDAARAEATVRDQLGKLGNTDFQLSHLELALSQPWFLPAGALNALRREAVAKLEAARLAAHPRPARAPAVEPPVPYPDNALSYLGNVFNAAARAFYARHGVTLIEPAYESNQETGEVSLMITRHCLRYSFNLCPKQVKGLKADPLLLMNGKERLTLRFDCKPCEMHVIGKLKKDRVVQITPV